MDPHLNANVQSALVRTLSSIPTKTASFVHGVKDNVPPFSRERIRLDPYSRPTTGQTGKYMFKFPQLGYIDQCYLMITMKNQYRDSTTALQREVYNDVGEMQTFENNHRIPWFHPCQLLDEQTRAYNARPYGYGGATRLARQTATPTAISYYQLDSNKSSSLYTLFDPFSLKGNASNSWNAIKCLGDIHLKTRNKLIETLPSECIPQNVLKMAPDQRDFFMKSMVGWSAGDETGAFNENWRFKSLFDPSSCYRNENGNYILYNPHEEGATRNTNTNYFRNYHADFIVPVTMSSFRNLSKNLQTRFVEELELHVDTKNFASGFNDYTANITTSSYDIQLVVEFRTWHDNIEKSIREANYAPGVPASIYGTNWFKEFDGSHTSNRFTLPFKCRNLVNEIVIVTKRKTVSSPGTTGGKITYSEYCPALNGQELNFNVVLSASGKNIIETTSLQLMGPYSKEYDLDTRRMIGLGGGSSGTQMKDFEFNTMSTFRVTNEALVPVAANTIAYDITRPSQCGIEFGFTSSMFSINFGLQSHDEYYTGGIAFQTLSNPTLVITPTHANNTNEKDIFEEYEFSVYCRYSHLLSIDSDTGVITRMLDV